jgi:hypothetical protein
VIAGRDTSRRAHPGKLVARARAALVKQDWPVSSHQASSIGISLLANFAARMTAHD